MKIFKFFVKEIFFKRILFIIGVFLLAFMANYLVFTATRSSISTLLGYKEVSYLKKDNSFVANLDPSSPYDLNDISEEEIKEVYDYLGENFTYGFYTDGVVANLDNPYDMEVSFAYLNETYDKINSFDIAKGENISFDYDLKKNDEIPVLIGHGLSENYPIGSKIDLFEYGLLDDVRLRVVGILNKDDYRTNIYVLNSKQYNNFSVILPINDSYIEKANLALKAQGLSDLILLDTNEKEIAELKAYIKDKLNFDFNFLTQEEISANFKEYYLDALKLILLVSGIIALILSFINIYLSISGLNMMIKDLTINLFAGLSLEGLRKIFYKFFLGLFALNLLGLYAFVSISRYGSWLRKEILSATFGFLSLTSIDWMAFGLVVLFNLIMCLVIVEISMARIKKIPISLGVLQ
ncbi:MAG: ABC transporter permease [Anaerococcus sp.]|nr:ABC transporter permease [Anaerococcus sp.]